MKHQQQFEPSRRSFFALGPVLAAASISAIPLFAFGQKGEKNEKEEEVSTNEDLMREHGILKRVLLAYQEIVRRIRAREDFSPKALIEGATIIRNFIEDYREKLEEDHLFPRFRKAGKLVDLVNTLYAQHQAGRRVTDRVLTAAGSLKTQEDRDHLATDLEAFNRMYAPHEAREDTVLFPELHNRSRRAGDAATGHMPEEEFPCIR